MYGLPQDTLSKRQNKTWVKGVKCEPNKIEEDGSLLSNTASLTLKLPRLECITFNTNLLLLDRNTENDAPLCRRKKGNLL